VLGYCRGNPAELLFYCSSSTEKQPLAVRLIEPDPEAFSSEVDTGSHWENASKQERPDRFGQRAERHASQRGLRSSTIELMGSGINCHL
jgi:hypothetical protein